MMIQKMHAKVEKPHRLDTERKTAAPRACKIAVQMLPHARPNSNQIEQQQHAPNKTAANLALSHMALTFVEETLNNLEHAYSAALLEHTCHQSRLGFSNSGSRLRHGSPRSGGERERVPAWEEELRDRSCRARRTEYIKQYRLPRFQLQSTTSEIPVARQT